MNPHALAMQEKSLATTANLYVYSHLLIPRGLYSLVVGCSPADSHYPHLSSGCSLADGHYSRCMAAHLLMVTTLSWHMAAHPLTVTTLSLCDCSPADGHYSLLLCGCSPADGYYSLVVWSLTCWRSLPFVIGSLVHHLLAQELTCCGCLLNVTPSLVAHWHRNTQFELYWCLITSTHCLLITGTRKTHSLLSAQLWVVTSPLCFPIIIADKTCRFIAYKDITNSSVCVVGTEAIFSQRHQVSCHFSSIKSLLFSQLIACSY